MPKLNEVVECASIGMGWYDSSSGTPRHGPRASLNAADFRLIVKAVLQLSAERAARFKVARLAVVESSVENEEAYNDALEELAEASLDPDVLDLIAKEI